MKLGLICDDAQNLLRVTYEGPYSLADAKEIFLTILKILMQHRAQKVLVDAREVSGEPTTSERFAYKQFIAQAVFDLEKRDSYTLPRFA